MPLILLKNLPRYECLLEASQQFPDLEPSACEAFLHLLRAGDEALSVTERHLARHNVTQGRFGVLMILLQSRDDDCLRRPLSPAELADRTGVTRATITGLVDTLERDGLVKREPDAADRRMMAVSLTAKGEELSHSLLPGYFQQMTAFMHPLSAAERRTLVQLLTKLVRPSAPEPDGTPEVEALRPETAPGSDVSARA